MYTTDTVQKALEFATIKHAKQVRKFSGEPYVYHPISVSNTIKELHMYYGIEHLIILRCAALLHDILEDTDTTVEELTSEFGSEITDIVVALTNDKSLLQSMGKTEYLSKKVNELTSDQLLVKLADRLDNVQDIKDENDPWTVQYVKQTKHVFFDHLNTDLGPQHRILLDKIRDKISHIKC